MDDAQIHRNSLSAWQALSSVGGLEPAGRDEELIELLRKRLDPGAESLEQALAQVSVNEFLTALFASIQPFVGMFRDVLHFFKNADAHRGQGQLRLGIDDEIAELKHFEEFLETWSRVEFDIDAPELDRNNAFALLHVLREMAKGQLLRFDPFARLSSTVHGRDVQKWLDAHEAGHYLAIPASLAPDRQPKGLDDAARVVMAAVHVINERYSGRSEMIAEHRERSYHSVEEDALHPWTIAQSETDFWLKSQVQFLSDLLRESSGVREEIGRRLTAIFEQFGRRRFSINADIRSLERILSLPAWKRRYEVYGVWVATQIIEALGDHDVAIKHDDGVLRFGFAETLLADIDSSRPLLSLYTERWSPLDNPIGKSRTAGAQPDYGIWTRDRESARCVLVVEVKHYKRESTTNFGAGLSDYARAHPHAQVVLVNYGPAKAGYGGLLGEDKRRCTVIGNFYPDLPKPREQFGAIVRAAVGQPVQYSSAAAALGMSGIVALDVSASMSSIFESDWFWTLMGKPEHRDLEFFLIDVKLRATVTGHQLRDWIGRETLGHTTSLSNGLDALVAKHLSVTLITDREGAASLVDFEHVVIELLDAHPDVRMLRLANR